MYKYTEYILFMKNDLSISDLMTDQTCEKGKVGS